MKLRRLGAGMYQTTINGHRYDIVNMQGQSVLYSGLGRHWEIRKDGTGEYGIGSITIDSFYTFREARARLVEIEGRTTDAPGTSA